jgi:hypothetical protein
MFIVKQATLNPDEPIVWGLKFDTREEAEQEVKDHITNCINAVEGGSMQDSPDPTDFTIEEVEHHPANIRRAEWARNALAVFTEETYGGDDPDTMHPGDRETAVQDLITDLLHYLTQNPTPGEGNEDPEETPEELVNRVHKRALGMYYEEIEQPEF